MAVPVNERQAVRPVPFDDGLVLVSRHDQLFVLDALASRIWWAISQGCTPTEIAVALTEARAGDVNQIQRDVVTLVSQWRAAQLLDPPAPVTDNPPPSQPPAGNPRWAGEWTCRFGHAVIDVAAESPWARTLAHWLEPFAADGDTATSQLEVREGHKGEPVLFVDGREYARHHLMRHVHRALITLVWRSDPLCAILHAGAVALGDKAVCIPGVSGAGKTTLIAHLAGRGHSYLADDLVPLSMRGDILPWPMPLRVKENSWSVVAARHPALEDALPFDAKGTRVRRLTPATDAWRRGRQTTRLIIFPRFERAARTQVTPLTPFAALQRLVAAELLLESPITEERAESFLSWVSKTPAYALCYGDLDEAESQVHRLLDVQ